MPLRGHHHGSSASTSHNAPSSQLDTASGIYHAAQTLGSVGAPTGNLRVATSGTTAAGTDSLFPSSGNAPGLSSGGQTAPPMSSSLPSSGAPNPASAPVSALSSSSQQFETPRRGQTFERQPEELHIPSNAAMGQHGSRELPLHAQQQLHHSSQEYFPGVAPGISLQQATPQGSHYSQSRSGPTLPGALQAGNAGRPIPLSSNTAPSTVPTVPQISTQSQQYTTPTRSAAINHPHSYSRSSPSSLDQQKYIPFSNTPESSQYASPPNHKYSSSQTQQGATSYSPLVLADVRPRADSDGPTSANPYSYDGASPTPTNSNYLAPWAIYAFDWCKWPVQQYHGSNSAGKMAVGSYLEDGHNFVSAINKSYSFLGSIALLYWWR